MRCTTSVNRVFVFSYYFVFLLCLLLVPSVSFAQGDSFAKNQTGRKKAVSQKPDPVTGWFLIGNFAAAFNGPGVRIIGRGGYQWRIYSHDHLAFSNNYVRLGLIGQATPANIGIGPNISIQPTSFLRFGANYSFRAYFPAFTVGTLYKDLAALKHRFNGTKDWSDGEARVNAQRDLIIGKNQGRVGLSAHLVRLHWLVQLRAFGFVAQFLGIMQFWFANYNDTDRSELFYEAGNDLVIQRQDQVITTLALFGYQWKNFRFLAVNTYQFALQSKEEALALGPALQWTIAEKWGIWKKPYLLFVVRWWVRHRYRMGALPNFAVVFQSEFSV